MRRRVEPAGGQASAVIEGFTGLERIGSGGFSVVYRAREAALNRDVAIKVLNSGLSTETERRTFERECRALGQLTSHPNIVTVYRPAFTSDMRPCIVMELYHGNFRERLERSGPLPIGELLSVGVRIAGALHTAHTRGVLHRDVKPHNIFLSAYGEPALGDFGISTIDDERSHSAASGLSVAYAAPELLEDESATAASDVYALGATLYHLAAGTAPFSSGDLRTSVRRILTEPPPALSRPDAHAGLDRVLRACMAKDPADRPSTALQVAEMFRHVEARAGLAQTSIPTARTGSGSDHQPSPSAVSPGLLPPPVPGAAPAPPASSAGVTVARRHRPAEPEPDAPPHRSVPAARLWIGAGAAAAAIALVVGGVVLFGDDGGGGTTDTSVATTTPPPDTFFDVLATPQTVTVAVAADGAFTVDVAPVAGALSYEIELLASGETVTVEAGELPATVTAAGVDTLCVVVRAVGEAGRVSHDSRPACSA